MSKFHSLTINSIDKVTAKSVAITFDIPKNLKQNFKFKAGQYITLKTHINGDEVRRDYSICSSVKSNEVTVAIKSVENGQFSVYANTKLKKGDKLEVSEPNGRFIFEPNSEKTRTITAFAAGSGITPILSITKTILEEEPFSNFILVYGNKRVGDTMFMNELLQLKKAYGNRFHLHFIYSQERNKDALFGRIDKSIVNLIVKNKYKTVTISRFYLCGPETMIHTVKDTLIENNIKASKILFELFTTSTDNTTEIKASNSNETAVKLSVDFEDFEFTMSKEQTILEAALKQNIDAPYSCQGGICSSCMAKVTEGKATMIQNNILTDDEIEDGLILTCQAHPVTDNIVIDFDDV